MMLFVGMLFVGIRYAHGMDAGGEVICESYECMDRLLVDGSSICFFFLEL